MQELEESDEKTFTENQIENNHNESMEVVEDDK